MYLLNCFFIYSILGFFIEALMTLIFKGSFSSGILFGPWTPVYGIGTVLIIIISNKLFKNLHMNRLIETIVVFFIVSFSLSFLEWLGGTLIEIIFDTVFWDYSNQKFNLGKYISLEMTLLWGILSIIFIYIIRPIFDKIIKKIPKWLTIILSILFIIDVIMTFLIRLNIIKA